MGFPVFQRFFMARTIPERRKQSFSDTKNDVFFLASKFKGFISVFPVSFYSGGVCKVFKGS